MMYRSNWIWIPGWNAEDKDEPRIVCFRKVFDVDRVPEKLEVKISADSRYKLYVNGKLAEIGPSKGDNRVWYYDTVDLAPYLVKGKNVLAVKVLRYPLEFLKGNMSVFRTQSPGFYFIGEYAGDNGEAVSLSADESWKCLRDPNVKLLPDSPLFSHLYIMEEASGNPDTFGWMGSGYDDSSWQSAEVQWRHFLLNKASSPCNLHVRTIPYEQDTRKVQGSTVIRESCLDRTE